jgi:hypothetical protein
MGRAASAWSASLAAAWRSGVERRGVWSDTEVAAGDQRRHVEHGEPLKAMPWPQI